MTFSRVKFPIALALVFTANHALAQDPASLIVIQNPAPQNFEGTVAPPTAAASAPHGDGIQPGLELFVQYQFTVTKAQDGSSSWYHEFDIPRAHAALDGKWKDVTGRFLVEGVRSASDGALIGVAGDSLVLRIREAFAGWHPIESIELAAGVVPTLTIPEIDGTWMLRAIAPSTLEAAGLESPADLGARASWAFPKSYGRVSVAAYNGEGYASPELNRGKNVEGAVEVHPAPFGATLPLGIFVSAESGSTGTELARANRATGGVVWQGAKLRAGIVATYAWGVDTNGDQRAIAADSFVRVEPINKLIFGARASYLVRDVGANPVDAITSFWATIGYRIRDPLEAFVAFTRQIPTTRADSELPGTNEWDLRAIGRVVF